MNDDETSRRLKEPRVARNSHWLQNVIECEAQQAGFKERVKKCQVN